MEKFVAAIPLNWELLKNPINWVMVFLMITIAGVGLTLIMQEISTSNATGVVE